MSDMLYPPKGPCYADLKGKVALVTGGGTGIGRGICLRFAEEGMQVFFCGRREDKLRETAEMARSRGGDATYFVTDVSREDEVDRLFANIRERVDRMDILVHNAALLGGKPIMQTDTATWQAFMSTNVDSAFFLVKRAGEMMIPRASGAIIFISTIGAIRAHHTTPAYDGSKGAIDALTRALAMEMGLKGIRVNAIAPGPIPGRDADSHSDQPRSTGDLAFDESIPLDRFRQPYVPMGRFGAPAEIAAVAAFLASSQASYITGQVIAVDGGASVQLAPRGTYV